MARSFASPGENGYAQDDAAVKEKATSLRMTPPSREEKATLRMTPSKRKMTLIQLTMGVTSAILACGER